MPVLKMSADSELQTGRRATIVLHLAPIGWAARLALQYIQILPHARETSAPTPRLCLVLVFVEGHDRSVNGAQLCRHGSSAIGLQSG